MHRLNGRHSRKEVAETRFTLTKGEEEVILQKCNLLSSWLQPPRVSQVAEMTLELLALRAPEDMTSHTKTQTAPILGQHWVDHFVKRHPDLDTAFTKSVEYCRAMKSNNPLIVISYFDTV